MGQSQSSKQIDAHGHDESERRDSAASRRNSEGLKKANTSCLDRLFQVGVDINIVPENISGSSFLFFLPMITFKALGHTAASN